MERKPTAENESQRTLPDIRQTVVLNAPIQKVWNAVATSEGLAAWFMPNDFRPVVGHAFHLDAGPYGKSPCKVMEVDPPHRLSFLYAHPFRLERRRGDRVRGVSHDCPRQDVQGMAEAAKGAARLC